MKTLTAASLIIAALTTTAVARNSAPDRSTEKTTPVNFVQTEQRYLDCLNSGNNGVVESALAQVVKMVLVFPEQPFVQLRMKVRDLAENGRTPAIRYRAYLAAAILEDPSMFTDASDGSNGDNDVFVQAANILQKQLLGYSAAQ